jgi:DivIVA domain-containing protein
MPLTPADVHNITFRKAALGKRGYDADEVDALREEVTQEMIRLLEERESLEQQVRRAGPDETGKDLSVVSDELNRALRAREKAEREADALQRRLEQARRAGPPPAPAQAPAPEVNEQVLAMAQHTAEQHVLDADQESGQVLADAREQSERMVQQARSTALDIEQDALRRDGEAVTQLNDRRSALQHEIAELTEFAEHYRAGLADDVRHHGEF